MTTRPEVTSGRDTVSQHADSQADDVNVATQSTTQEKTTARVQKTGTHRLLLLLLLPLPLTLPPHTNTKHATDQLVGTVRFDVTVVAQVRVVAGAEQRREVLLTHVTRPRVTVSGRRERELHQILRQHLPGVGDDVLVAVRFCRPATVSHLTRYHRKRQQKQERRTR